MPTNSKLEVYQRADRKWGWKLWANKTQIIAIDGNQGYDHESDATNMARRIINGEWRSATVTSTPLPGLPR